MTNLKPDQSPSPLTQAHPYYPGLDIVRFLAACLVVAIHYESRYAWFGWAGVEIFFVISGLVIANSASVETAAIFLARRILRLYPAVWICTTLSLLALLLYRTDPQIFIPFPQYASVPGLLQRYLFSLALLPKVDLIDSVYWTLPIEMAFYGVIFLMLLARRISRLPVLACFLTFYSGLYVLLMLLPHFDSHLPELLPAFIVTHRVMAQLLLLQHGCVFATGIWIYLLTRRLSIMRWAGLTFAVAFSIGEILLQASIYKAQGMIFLTGPWAQVVVWIAGLAIIGLSLRRPGVNRQKNRWTRKLGLMTYPLYLIHNAVGETLIWVLLDHGVGKYIGVAIAVVLSLSLAFLISSFGEPAIRRRLRPLLWQEQGKAAPA
jgi:peptidoglycan/LPS O-acetylase OafA/YrhL